MGFEVFAANPAIKSSKVMLNQYVQLNWEFPDSLNYLIKGFQVQHSTDDRGPFINLRDTLLPVTERTFTDQATQTNNYYKVVAIDHGDEPHPSFPYIVLLIDSIPPVAPVGIKGDIDSTGIVTLNWDNNTEPDLLGYRVFRANHKRDEFSQITKDPVSKNQFIDTINVKTLTRKIYYKILAIDQHFSPSGFSDTLELKRPDKIPPVQAVFSEVITDEYGIKLSWVCSSSDDVIKHVLYRKAETSTSWNVVQIFEMIDSITSFNDTLTKAGTMYQYTMLAVDESGLESEPSRPVTMKAFERKIRPQVKDIKFKAKRDRKLIYITWEYPYNGVERFVIYRAMNDDLINLYDGVDNTIFEFEDKKLKPNNKYTYRLKVIYRDGTQSAFSEQFEVNY
jgi:fibronectin type 3 domain-containing protein